MMSYSVATLSAREPSWPVAAAMARRHMPFPPPMAPPPKMQRPPRPPMRRAPVPPSGPPPDRIIKEQGSVWAQDAEVVIDSARDDPIPEQCPADGAVMSPRQAVLDPTPPTSAPEAAPEQLVAADPEVAEEPSWAVQLRAAEAVGIENLRGEAFASALWAVAAEAAHIRRFADADCIRKFELAHAAAEVAREVESIRQEAWAMAEARGGERARSRRRPWAQVWPGHHGRRVGVVRRRAAKAERPPTTAELFAAAYQ